MQSIPAKLERSRVSCMDETERAAAKPYKPVSNWFIGLLFVNGI